MTYWTSGSDNDYLHWLTAGAMTPYGYISGSDPASSSAPLLYNYLNSGPDYHYQPIILARLDNATRTPPFASDDRNLRGLDILDAARIHNQGSWDNGEVTGPLDVLLHPSKVGAAVGNAADAVGDVVGFHVPGVSNETFKAGVIIVIGLILLALGIYSSIAPKGSTWRIVTGKGA